MPITKFSQTRFASFLAGLENYNNVPFFFSVDAQTLPAGGVSKWQTDVPISNTNAITSLQLAYTLDNVWRFTSGAITLTYNAGQFQVETLTYYSGSNLHVETYVINQTGGSLSLGQFFVNLRVSLFNAPF
jgi:hypothetical protein